MKTNTTVIMSSVVVATILVVGALVLPYNYAMAGARHSNSKSSFDFTSIKVNLEKKIKQQVESHARGGDANGGGGGSANGGAGGTSSGGPGGSVGDTNANGGTTGRLPAAQAALVGALVIQMLTSDSAAMAAA